MNRYQYTLYKPSNDPDNEPFFHHGDYYDLLAVKNDCTPDMYCLISFQVSSQEKDEFGYYTHWDTIELCSIEGIELINLNDMSSLEFERVQ